LRDQRIKWIPYVFLLLSLLVYFFLPEAVSLPNRRIIAIFVFAILFWAFEVIPLYVTSLWIVILLTLFFIPVSGKKEYSLFFSSFSNPLILLFFGGFVLAAAVRKHSCDEFLLTKILKLAGTNYYAILASLLFTSAFFSMWISNTAATAMMLALSRSLFEHVKEGDPIRKSLPLAIAFGANIGGMGTPIGTPPNAIALGMLKEYGGGFDFLKWMLMTLPLVLAILIFVFLLLSVFFVPKEKRILGLKTKVSALTKGGKKTLAVAGAMIVLWLTGPIHGISETWVALLGVAVFASFRLITLEDLKRIDWDILILMWGGLALGLGIEKSEILTPYLSHLSIYNEVVIIVILSLFAFFLSTFISNTAAANLLLPFAVAVASVSIYLIAIPVALSCSLAMALPVSTPPNALAYSLGSLKTSDMIKLGLPIGIFGLIIIFAGFEWVIPLVF